MNLLIASFIVLFISSMLILLTEKVKTINACIFLSSLLLTCILLSIPAFHCLINLTSIELHIPLTLPAGEFFIGLDPLSAFFLLVIALLFFTCGIYGYGYFKTSPQQKTSTHYAFYQLLLLSILLVVTAKDAVLFLVAWEFMTLFAYLLIIYNDEKKSVCNAGYLYLIATHAGTFFLWAMFIIMSHYAGSFNFNLMALTKFPYQTSGIIFIFALIGFGVKAGIIPLHIWLPHAHPAAPSHISALLSGIIIKIGIYGLLRIIFMIKHFPTWCALSILLMGMLSGIVGVLYALGQHEIKKLLAYHSIENIGIILLGIGIGLWGQTKEYHIVSIIGFASALLHIFNHAVFKGLLFLSAGSVIRSAHTGEIDQLGGLLKKLPWTGHLFLIGSLSICGLPFFNGFISEWLLYRSFFEGLLHSFKDTLILLSLAIVSLALIGGLAAACFAKAFGTIFLGNRRENKHNIIKEESYILFIPMIMLGAVCLWIGLFPNIMVSFSLQIAGFFSGNALLPAEQATIIKPLNNMIIFLRMVIGITLILFLLKRYAMQKLPVTYAKTWGCGYILPTSRMQYTASSFAQPLMNIFRNIVGYKTKGTKIDGYFPKEGVSSSKIVESSETYLFKPLFHFIEFLSTKLKCIQNGYTQLYLLYFLIFILTLLIWKMN